jgi:glycosyltransferase involved in cell wall biosynthesis
MTMGLVIVSVDLPATTQIIKETNCGIILEKRDAQLLAEKLRDLLNDNTKRKELQEKSSEASNKKYNWKSEADKLFQFYRSLK